MKITDYSALEIAAQIKTGSIKAADAVEAVYDKIEEREATCHCYVTLLDKETVLKKAEEVQKRIDTGQLSGALAGVPAALKDNMCMEGMPTTCSSRILHNFIPSYTCEAAVNLEKHGVILIGKTNMDEFAMGSTTETSAYGVTRNPHNPAHVPGGSSGGSAAAVAAGECLLALGSDTGGSIRQPASYCGITGLKPTYGTVSRYGLVAYGSSLDQIGPLGKNIADCAAALEVIASYDCKDATSLKRTDTDFTKALVQDVRGLRIGIPKEYIGEGLEPEIRSSILTAMEKLAAQGAIVEEIDLGLTAYAIPAYYTIAAAEASSNLERFDGVKYGHRAIGYDTLSQMYQKTRSEGFGTEVKRRIMLGSFVLSSGYYDAYYLKALRVKAMIVGELTKALEKYDIIAGPTAPSTAPLLGSAVREPLKMYLGDIYTVSANLAGLPAVSIPCGKDSSGLPIGLQLMGRALGEKTLIQAAYTYEQSSPA